MPSLHLAKVPPDANKLTPSPVPTTATAALVLTFLKEDLFLCFDIVVVTLKPHVLFCSLYRAILFRKLLKSRSQLLFIDYDPTLLRVNIVKIKDDFLLIYQHCDLAFLSSKDDSFKNLNDKIISAGSPKQNIHFTVFSAIVADFRILAYNPLMKTTRKIVAVTSLALIAVFGLSACASVTEADISNADHKIVEVDSGSMFSRDWEYEDSTGSRVKMAECEGNDFFSKNCFETSDKLVRFEYSTHKGRLRSEVITYDGVEHLAECIRRGGFSDSMNYCGSDLR